MAIQNGFTHDLPPGGEHNQILIKKSDKDYDVCWDDDTTDAKEVSFNNEETGMDAENVQDAINELFTYVSDGKALIASAITDMGVETDTDATFEQIKENILKISSANEPDYEWFTPKMTSDTTPSPFVASATATASVSTQDFKPWKAFDGINATRQTAAGALDSCWASIDGGGYVQIDFGGKVPVLGFKINSVYRNNGTIAVPYRMKILGSNDNNVWDTIGDYKNIAWHSVGEYSTFMLDHEVNYRYYRFGAENLTAADVPSASYISIVFGDIQFYRKKE